MTNVLQQNVNMVIQFLNCSVCRGQDNCFFLGGGRGGGGYVIRHMVEVKSFPIMKSRAIFKSYLEVWD